MTTRSEYRRFISDARRDAPGLAAWRVFLAFGVLAAPLVARGQSTAPFVLDAPSEVRALIERHADALQPVSGALDELELRRLQERAREQVTELLATEGYFSPTIGFEPAAATAQPPYVLRVHTGPRTVVRDVRIDFAGAVAGAAAPYAQRREALRSAWPLNPGEPFRQSAWGTAKQLLLRSLAERDFALARIADSEATINADAATASLFVLYDSGPAFTLGELEISGLKNYSRALVERYATFAPGEPYSQDKLLEFQARLQNTPYFGRVLVEVTPDASLAARAPVRVTVTEEPSKRLSLGAGYSTNTGARVEARFAQADFLDRGWQLATGLRVEQLRQGAFVDVYLPPDAKNYIWSFGTLLEATDIKGLRTRRGAVAVVRSRTTERFDRSISLTLQRERTAVADGPTRTHTALFPGWSWTRREVDDPLNPRRGNVINLQAHAAAKALLSDQNFFRAYGQLHLYYPVGALDTLSARVEAGQVFAPGTDGVPQDLLFRAGGTRSVRGYAYHSLGPQLGSAVVGGSKLLTGSVEYTHWFVENWGGALFVDAGNAANAWGDLDLRIGYGLGARWRSPAGPVAVDVAYGQHDGRVRLHFSLQVAF